MDYCDRPVETTGPDDFAGEPPPNRPPPNSHRHGAGMVRGRGEDRRLGLFSRMGFMKADIHPEYTLANVHCSCGNQFYTRSTKSDLHVELCSACHPFYTGKQKLVDTGGRVERFQRRAAKRAKATAGQN